MSYITFLTSDCPVAVIKNKIEIQIRVVDEKGNPQGNLAIAWSIANNKPGPVLDKKTGTTDATEGVDKNVISSDKSVAFTVIATLPDGSTATLDLGFSDGELRAPLLPQINDGVINDPQSVELIQAEILRHADAEKGDLYTFFWGNVSISRIDDGTSSTFPWLMDVRKTFSENDILADGDYYVYYKIEDVSGNVSYCSPVSVHISGSDYVNAVYEAPTFPEIKNDLINVDAISNPDGVLVNVGYPQQNKEALLTEGDLIILHMTVYDKSHQEVLISDEKVSTYTIKKEDITSNKIQFRIPNKYISDDKGTFDHVYGKFWYVVQGVENNGISYSKTLSIDTVSPH